MMGDVERAAVGALIRQLREDRKLSQAEVAAALTVSPGAVSQWEVGKTLPNRTRGRALDALLRADGRLLDALGYGALSAAGVAHMAAEVAELRRTTEALAARLDELERGDPPPSATTDPPAPSARSPRRL